MNDPQKGARLHRAALLAAALCPVLLVMSGCDDDDDDDAPEPQSGVFVDAAVAGLDVVGSQTPAGVTDSAGTFQYIDGETLQFSIGELALGSAEGAPELTPLSITEGATAASDVRVHNKLILLQSLDADGDLNTGIQISEAIRAEVSANAPLINFELPVEEFRAALEPVLANLEAAGALADTDPRARTVRTASAALDHFNRATSPRNVVTVTGGDISGFEATADVWQYLGIPYAAPPLGDLRWRAPQPLEPWEGVRDAVEWGDQAAQNPALERFGLGGMSEDSLVLNVTAPKDADGLPVMVWFHGGGFTALTSNTAAFNNAEGPVTKGVVQVSVNHRLGPFGYIAHPELSAESGYNGSGNYGQMDLVAALQWVQENIAAFGGDPDTVTIFGESGGGRKTLSLIASPQGAGLFHRAISQSGTLYPDTRSLAAVEAIGMELQTQLGAASLEEMRNASWLEVVSAAAELTPYTNVDNHYQPTTERVAIETGQHNDVPFMFSINTNDTPDPTATAISVFPWLADHSSADHFAAYFTHMPAGWAARGVETYHAGELTYVFNAKESVISHYLLGLVIDPATGESLVIGDLNGNGVSGSQGDGADIYASAGFDETDERVIDRTMTIWTHFAKTGNPSVEGEIDWPLYGSDDEAYVNLGVEPVAGTGLSDVLQP